MKKKILYSILNEWRDDDMDDSPIDLDDDDFALSTTQETSYEYFPETREELKKIVRMGK